MVRDWLRLALEGSGYRVVGVAHTAEEGLDLIERRRPALSPREREVLRLVAGGSTNKDIATALSIGDETVKTLLARACAKLGVRRRAEAVSEAHKRGLL